ncbi:MAG: hypothetical protein P1U38_09860 [Aeromicrobium sp.]|uniref:hypothetical protein n=1 Tax=Aeromicrobium sp. TaxID=1871063 RepID=UPI002614EE21|nr:hypothetical protein [Aeromicrobium sp.]MDF1705067.1 hypothetical protein [Aeromicrobium sp.]
MSQTDKTATEVMESLTGFDEIAIAQQFGSEVLVLGKDRQTAFMRAMVFIDLRRAGSSDAEARQDAMSLPLKEVNEYFAADDEIDADDPDTDAGKGALTFAEVPTS